MCIWFSLIRGCSRTVSEVAQRHSGLSDRVGVSSSSSARGRGLQANIREVEVSRQLSPPSSVYKHASRPHRSPALSADSEAFYSPYRLDNWDKITYLSAHITSRKTGCMNVAISHAAR